MDSGVMSNSSSLAWHWGIRSSLQLRVDFHLTSISIVIKFYKQSKSIIDSDATDASQEEAFIDEMERKVVRVFTMLLQQVFCISSNFPEE